MSDEKFWLTDSPMSEKEWANFLANYRMTRGLIDSACTWTKAEVGKLLKQIEYMNQILAMVMTEPEGEIWNDGFNAGRSHERGLASKSLEWYSGGEYD